MVNDKLDQIKLLSQFTESEAIKATNIIWEDIQREYKSLSSVEYARRYYYRRYTWCW